MDWITFIIPAIVACMALVLLKLVDEKRRKTKERSNNQKMSIMMYALTFSATFAFVWGIGFLQRNNKTAGIESGGDASVVDIDKMIEMTDHSGKAPF